MARAKAKVPQINLAEALDHNLDAGKPITSMSLLVAYLVGVVLLLCALC